MLLLRRDRLQLEQIKLPLLQAAQAMEAALMGRLQEATVPRADLPALTQPQPLPDPFESDLTPWLMRRLGLSTALAGQLREEARGFQAAGPPPG
jgi:hypothetical protein